MVGALVVQRTTARSELGALTDEDVTSGVAGAGGVAVEAGASVRAPVAASAYPCWPRPGGNAWPTALWSCITAWPATWMV